MVALLAQQTQVTGVQASRMGQAVLLFVLLALVLGALFVVALVLTRARRVRRNASDGATAPATPIVDPWKEAGQRVKSPSQD